jgi:5-methylcytosine-specific restriction protein A
MPYKLPHICAKPGCSELTLSRYCQKHEYLSVSQDEKDKRAEYDRGRGSASSRGYDSRWRGVRLAKLKQDPLCEDCRGIGLTVLATDVDHIDGNVSNLSPDNLRSLCHACHSRKTIRENGGFGKKKKS